MDFDRRWIIKIGDKEHKIEADFGANIVDPEDKSQVLIDKPGSLVVDGKVVQTWGSDLPDKVSVQIDGKSIELRKAGIFVKGLDLVFEGKKIKPIEQ